MNAGVNGPIDRNEGAYNGYAAVKAFWADTTNTDNLRGGDATGLATPGAQEVTSDADGVSGFGNTVHSYSGDSFYRALCCGLAKPGCRAAGRVTPMLSAGARAAPDPLPMTMYILQCHVMQVLSCCCCEHHFVARSER